MKKRKQLHERYKLGTAAFKKEKENWQQCTEEIAWLFRSG